MTRTAPARIEKIVRTLTYRGRLHKPHNGLMEHMGRNPECSLALVYFVLTKRELKRLDPDRPPYRISGRSIDVDGTLREADLVYCCPTLGGGCFYLVIEHKSWPDRNAPLQAMRIRERLWSWLLESDAGKIGSLPEIRYIVFYHGAEEWKVPSTFEEMTGMRADQTRRSLGTRLYSLLRLGMRRVCKLTCLRMRSALMAFVLSGFEEKVSPRHLRMMAEGIECDELGCYLVLYIVQVLQVPTEVLKEALVCWSPDGKGVERFMSTIFEEGLQEGRQEGRQEGKAETFLKLARAQFQTVPKRLEKRVRSASMAQLDNWLLRLLKVDSLDAVFKASARG